MSMYERETVEFIPVVVTVDGAQVTAGVEFAVTLEGVRPTAWMPPVTLGAAIGVMTDHQPPGGYIIWARITSSPEIPVIRCGWYTVT